MLIIPHCNANHSPPLAFNLPHFNGRLNAAVESDIVGYTKIECKAGFNLLGVPFADLDAKKDGISAQSIQGNFKENDQIQYWDGNILRNLVYYSASEYGPAGWYNFSDDAYATKTFAPGEGFWVKVQQETAVTIAGKVVVGAKGKVIAPAKSFTLISLNYPQATEVNKIAFKGLTEEDQIQYWDGNILRNLIYYSASEYGPAGWYNFSDDAYATKTFAPSEGFWILPKNEVSLEF